MICEDPLQERMVRYLRGRRMLGGEAALRLADVAWALETDPERIAEVARSLEVKGLVECEGSAPIVVRVPGKRVLVVS